MAKKVYIIVLILIALLLAATFWMDRAVLFVEDEPLILCKIAHERLT